MTVLDSIKEWCFPTADEMPSDHKARCEWYARRLLLIANAATAEQQRKKRKTKAHGPSVPVRVRLEDGTEFCLSTYLRDKAGNVDVSRVVGAAKAFWRADHTPGWHWINTPRGQRLVPTIPEPMVLEATALH